MQVCQTTKSDLSITVHFDQMTLRNMNLVTSTDAAKCEQTCLRGQFVRLKQHNKVCPNS